LGEFRSLKNLLAEIDILSLHVPLTSETRHLIDAAAWLGRGLAPCSLGAA